MITLDNVDLIRSAQAASCEWLETNGRGGYASGSLINCHTRKYHGLLVANLNQPAGRYVLLSQVEDSVVAEGREYFFVTHQYPGFFFTGGQPLMLRYEGDPWPKFFYRTEDARVEKEVMMVTGADAVMLRYRISRVSDHILRLKPFLAYRGIHTLAEENPYLRGEVHETADGYRMNPYDGMPGLFIQIGGLSRFLPLGVWYRQFEYAEEKSRGYDFREDLYCPGVIEVPMSGNGEVLVCFSTEPLADTPKNVWQKERTKRSLLQERNEPFVLRFEEDRDLMRILSRAADQFLIRTPKGRHAVIAGYHWFYEWGRDTLISLPGLTFCRGRFPEGQEILKTFADFEQDGLFPNFFSETERENAYNTVDASLWFFWAVQQYLKYGGEEPWLRRHIWPVMKRVLKQFMAGTVYDIFMDDRGLLHAGSEGTRLTWMDALVDGLPATPRWGYMVEINALWYNALCFSHELAERFDDHEFVLADLISLCRESFRGAFRTDRHGGLADVHRHGFLDMSIRPNQILAVSLHYSPLDPQEWLPIVEEVRRLLLTPCGLRTLAPDNVSYRGRCAGVMKERDLAYHQGTVWPWLMGQFGEAFLKANRNTKKARTFLRKWIRNFLKGHFREAGLGCVSEIFDGDPPHHPGGCIAQAWSTAELIRLLTVLQDPPP